MSVIRVLPQSLASQIAAGEVIERPASVVRELMDNSIDAGTDRIHVEIAGGGRSRIKVADHGVGMSREDLELCVLRHATSKIGSAVDLSAIRTLGFRGEALPSIASVSRMTLISRPHHETAAFRLEMEGAAIKSLAESGSPPGTIVEVRDLFFNLPARRKFLRTERTEGLHIIDAITRLAVAYPEVAIRFEEDGREGINLAATEEPRVRLAALLGREVAEEMSELHSEWGGFRIRVFAAPGEYSRKRSDRVFVYVNRRYVRDRLVNRAIMDGYGQRLMRGQYPQAAVFIEMDPGQVDVNVHPTKQEVRFQNAQAVFRAIRTTVEKSFGTSFPAPNLPSQRIGQSQAEFEPSPMFSTAEPVAAYGSPPMSRSDLDAAPGQEPVPSREEKAYSVIGQLGGTYILCETADGLLLVDQHAAHERILYEHLRRQVREGHPATQVHLFPVECELSPREARLAKERREDLLKVGIELDHFGGNTFLLRGMPAVLKDGDWKRLLSDLFALLEEHKSLSGELVLERMLVTMACHGAIRAGDRLLLPEMERLLEELRGLDLPGNCPHGRPVYRRIVYGELERMFKRMV